MNTTPQESRALALSSASAGALLMDSGHMDRIERIADLMASGKTTVPQHLRGSKGDCFAITLQSMQWGMNPFSVAQKTHLVNGTLGYEAQLVAAVVNSSGAVLDRFHFDWFGAWEKIVGKFKEVESKTKKDDNGNFKKYIVPAWNQADEQGLGVRVWATLKGEATPRELTLLMTQARTRNSTLWTEDPKQQLAYLAQKRWARLFAPDVILGVYTPDELADPGEKHMGPVEEVRAEPTAYPADQFAEKLPQWRKSIEDGKTDAERLIAFITSRNPTTPLTAEQQATLRTFTKGGTVIDVQDKREAAAPADRPAEQAAAPTYAEVADRIQKAESQDHLQALDEVIGQVADQQQRAELTAMAAKRSEDLPAF